MQKSLIVIASFAAFAALAACEKKSEPVVVTPPADTTIVVPAPTPTPAPEVVVPAPVPADPASAASK